MGLCQVGERTLGTSRRRIRPLAAQLIRNSARYPVCTVRMSLTPVFHRPQNDKQPMPPQQPGCGSGVLLRLCPAAPAAMQKGKEGVTPDEDGDHDEQGTRFGGIRRDGNFTCWKPSELARRASLHPSHAHSNLPAPRLKLDHASDVVTLLGFSLETPSFGRTFRGRQRHIRYTVQGPVLLSLGTQVGRIGVLGLAWVAKNHNSARSEVQEDVVRRSDRECGTISSDHMPDGDQAQNHSHCFLSSHSAVRSPFPWARNWQRYSVTGRRLFSWSEKDRRTCRTGA